MKKRVLSFILALLLCVTLVPTLNQPAFAATQYSYNATAALEYAKNHWDDGKGQCADFVSNCVIAGGLEIKAQSGTGPCYRAIGKATGIGPTKESENSGDLACLPTLTLDSKGNATKSANSDILAAGDVVIQWCSTHHIAPHILICGGYNSSGYATYYAHNKALNNSTYNLKKNTSNNHTTSCDMGGKVIHLTGNGTPTAAAPTTAPTNLKLNNIASRADASGSVYAVTVKTGDTVTLTWDAVSNATKYKVEPMVWNGSEWALVGSTYTKEVSGTSVSYNNLLAGAWVFKVTAGNTAGWSSKYARWNKALIEAAASTGTFTIKYDANGGTGAPSSHSVAADSKGNFTYTLSTSTPTRSGYKFLYWQLENNPAYGNYSPGQTVTDNWGNGSHTLTFYAIWGASPDSSQTKTCTITFDANGGTGTLANITVQKDDKGVASFTLPLSGVTRSGYKLVGWSTEKNGIYGYYLPGQGVNVTAGKATENTTLTYYAQWEAVPQTTQAKTYTITFDANGGTGAPPKQTIEYNQNISSVVPTRSGYTFKGWGMEPTSVYPSWQPGEAFKFTQDLYLYAVWEATATVKVTISYDVNGGGGTRPLNHSVNKDKNGVASFTLTTIKPTRSGYTFLGWRLFNDPVYNTDKSGDSISIQLSPTENEVLTYYAQWQRN